MPNFKLKWPSKCHWCGSVIPAGSNARWHHAWGYSCIDSDACERRNPSVPLDKQKGISENGDSVNKGGSNEG